MVHNAANKHWQYASLSLSIYIYLYKSLYIFLYLICLYCFLLLPTWQRYWMILTPPMPPTMKLAWHFRNLGYPTHTKTELTEVGWHGFVGTETHMFDMTWHVFFCKRSCRRLQIAPVLKSTRRWRPGTWARAARAWKFIDSQTVSRHTSSWSVLVCT